MSNSTFSLSWEAHKSNICKGLSVLQQNEEFVDMTVAADGHFVKVHQMIMALASPYFKDLIASAGGRHPVIFLNKISSTTLCAILEYIYTGEVLISVENLSELLQTAKELHIKGLEDMKLQNSFNSNIGQTTLSLTQETGEHDGSSQGDHTENTASNEMDDEICYFEITDHIDNQDQKSAYLDDSILEDSKSVNMSEMDENYEEISLEEEESEAKSQSSRGLSTKLLSERISTSTVQYTVSNQGSIQMILNRYMYYLKHSNQNSTRQWRCVDYLNKNKCPAIVMTKDNVVLQRFAAHIHSHHDKRILKKVRVGAIFTAIKDAEEEGNQIKMKLRHNCSITHAEIMPYKGDSRWFSRDDYFYVASRSRGPSVSMRCASDGCPVRWILRDGIEGPLSNVHDHAPTPWVLNRNTMFQALKRRAASEPTSLNAIYEEEAARYPDAAPHLLWESVCSSMRKWRRAQQPAVPDSDAHVKKISIFLPDRDELDSSESRDST